MEQAYPDTPRVAVGAVVIRHGEVLLIRRAKPPSEDMWAIPGGSVRLGETLREAAERELKEETGVRARAGEAIHTFDVIEKDRDGGVRFHYVIVDFEAEYVDGEPSPNDDAREARWVTPEELASLPVNESTRRLLNTRFKFE
jgi:ADP-ribose pyrophosphatase